MQLHFWGVRGSIPAPLSPEQVQEKISAVIQRMNSYNAESTDAKTQFLASLPSWLYGTVGSNTSCTELTTDDNQTIILDCGSGLRELGKKYANKSHNIFHIMLSHFHWDHLQGLPFFAPAFNPTNELHFYSVFPKAKQLLEKQMSFPFFPVPFASFTKKIFFHQIKQKQTFQIGSTDVSCKKMFHPGNSYSYSFVSNNKKIIYATDVELNQSDFIKKNNDDFFKDADILILDSQYTVEEAFAKINWGHSAYTYVVDFAHFWHAKKLYLFHYEPNYDDKKLFSIKQSAQWYADFLGNKNLKVELALEGLDITV